MKRGEIYRCPVRLRERGNKAGFYVVVSRNFVAANDKYQSVICAAIYRRRLGIRSEVIVGVEEGLPRECAIRCDFLHAIPKKSLTGFVATLSPARLAELDRALLYALGLDT